MRTPAGLHDVLLGALRGKSRGRAAAHDVDDNQGNFGFIRQAQVFLFQREARAGTGRHRLDAGNGSADSAAAGAKLVFHLLEDAADLGQFDSHRLHDFRRGSNRIPRVEFASCRQRAKRDGLVALPEFDLSHYFVPSSRTVIARSGQIFSHDLQPMHSSGCTASDFTLSFRARTFLGQTETHKPHPLHQVLLIDTSNFLANTFTSRKNKKASPVYNKKQNL